MTVANHSAVSMKKWFQIGLQKACSVTPVAGTFLFLEDLTFIQAWQLLKNDERVREEISANKVCRIET